MEGACWCQDMEQTEVGGEEILIWALCQVWRNKLQKVENAYCSNLRCIILVYVAV